MRQMQLGEHRYRRMQQLQVRTTQNVGVISKPFDFEGAKRLKVAELGSHELEKHVDSLIVVLNEKLFEVMGEDAEFDKAFACADDVLHNAVSGIAEIINEQGLINVDFEDVKTVMSEQGKAMMGTATLETALFGVPEVVCYLGSPISYAIAKRIIKIKYISLVNLIMDKQVVEELIQDNLTADNIAVSLARILSDSMAIKEIREDYFQLNQLLKAGGKASEKAASIIHSMMK